MRAIIFGMCFIIIGCSPVDNAFFWESLNLDKEKIYLVFRGTETKQGIVVKSYNLFNDKVSHVGIAIYDMNSWKVFDVSNYNNVVSDLVCSNLNSFYKKDLNIKHASIWELKNFQKEKQVKLIKELEKFQKLQIKFDMTFSHKKIDKLYCSQFVYQVLKKIDSTTYKFKKHKKMLPRMHAVFFNKDSLEYYPVDMFQKHPGFQKIFEADF